MTRVCSWCGGILGEKCSKCGGPVLTIGEKFYKCEPCGFSFEAGDGGITNGICDPCRGAVPPVLNMLLPPDVLE